MAPAEFQLDAQSGSSQLGNWIMGLLVKICFIAAASLSQHENPSPDHDDNEESRKPPFMHGQKDISVREGVVDSSTPRTSSDRRRLKRRHGRMYPNRPAPNAMMIGQTRIDNNPQLPGRTQKLKRDLDEYSPLPSTSTSTFAMPVASDSESGSEPQSGVSSGGEVVVGGPRKELCICSPSSVTPISQAPPPTSSASPSPTSVHSTGREPGQIIGPSLPLNPLPPSNPVSLPHSTSSHVTAITSVIGSKSINIIPFGNRSISIGLARRQEFSATPTSQFVSPVAIPSTAISTLGVPIELPPLPAILPPDLALPIPLPIPTCICPPDISLPPLPVPTVSSEDVPGPIATAVGRPQQTDPIAISLPEGTDLPLASDIGSLDVFSSTANVDNPSASDSSIPTGNTIPSALPSTIGTTFANDDPDATGVAVPPPADLSMGLSVSAVPTNAADPQQKELDAREHRATIGVSTSFGFLGFLAFGYLLWWFIKYRRNNRWATLRDFEDGSAVGSVTPFTSVSASSSNRQQSQMVQSQTRILENNIWPSSPPPSSVSAARDGAGGSVLTRLPVLSTIGSQEDLASSQPVTSGNPFIPNTGLTRKASLVSSISDTAVLTRNGLWVEDTETALDAASHRATMSSPQPRSAKNPFRNGLPTSTDPFIPPSESITPPPPFTPLTPVAPSTRVSASTDWDQETTDAHAYYSELALAHVSLPVPQYGKAL